MDQAEIFRTLKPVCVRLSDEALKTRSGKSDAKNIISSVQDLVHVLDGFAARGQRLDERLVNYVFFPLSHLFKDREKFPVRSMELALRCLEILLQTGWTVINDPNVGVQLLILLTSAAQDGNRTLKSAVISDEVICASLVCLSELFRSFERSPSSKRLLYDTPNIPVVGHAITVILENMKYSVSAKVQIAAADALHQFCSCVAERDVLQSFAPGIFSALSLTLTPTTKARRSFRFLEKALLVLQDSIQLLLSDNGLEETPEHMRKPSQDPASGWSRAAAAQTKLVLANVVKLQQHDRLEVRTALLNLCWTVLEQCQMTLSSSVPMMLETAIALWCREGTDDQYFRLKHLTKERVAMVEHAKSITYDSLVSLPRVIMLNDDSAIYRATNQVATWLRILIDSDAELNVIDDLFQRTIRGAMLHVIGESKAIQTATEDQYPLEILSHGSNVLELEDFPSVLPVDKFAQDSLGLLNTLILTVSRSKGALRMADRALENAHDDLEETRLVDLWICLEILRSKVQSRQGFDGTLNISTADDDEDNTRNELYTLALSLISQPEPGKLLDWRVQAVALETIAFQASQTRVNFRAELVDALYPVVNLLGSALHPLRTHAVTCLNAMAAACEYLDTKEMLVANADYLVNAVGLQLNALEISPQGSRVLVMMIKLCGPSLLPYMDDLFESIFDALECFHGYSTLIEQLFSVLEAAVDEGVKSLPDVHMSNATPSHRKVSRRPLRIGNFVNFTRELGTSTKNSTLDGKPEWIEELPRATPQRPWKHLRGDEGAVSQSEENKGPERANGRSAQTAAQEAGKPTKIYAMLQRIASLTQHHLPSSSATIRASLLALLARAIPVLSSHDDTFLPLVHTLWPVLLPRLLDKEAFIVAGVLQVMGCICEGAGDFVSTRIEGVWPSVRKLLDRCNQSLGYLSVHPYQFSSDRRPVSAQGTSFLRPKQSDELTTSLTNFSKTKGSKRSEQPTQHSVDASRQNYYASTTNQMIQAALTNFLVLVVSHVRISEAMYLEALSTMLSPQLLNDEKQQTVREALRTLNADAVCLALERENSGNCSERRGSAAKNTSWDRIEIPVDVTGGPRFVSLEI